MIRKFLTLMVFMAMTAPCFAIPPDVTKADQDACTPDVFRLCSAYIPNEAPIVACLQSHKPDLSAECTPVIFPPAPVRQRRRAAS